MLPIDEAKTLNKTLEEIWWEFFSQTGRFYGTIT